MKVNPSQVKRINVTSTGGPLTIDHQLRTQALMILEMYNYNPEEGAWVILSDAETLGLEGIAKADEIAILMSLNSRKLNILLQLAI